MASGLRGLILITRSLVLLAPDNFTPLSRTPWAGKEIGARYKDLIGPGYKGASIGESWECSTDPEFPSRIDSGAAPTTLQALIDSDPEGMLSSRLAKLGDPTCEILVKLLNASIPLSLQVHPADDDAELAPHECGKPESWLVLHADAGAGIYLGFNTSISVEELEQRLIHGIRCRDLLQFVPVKPGDYFEIAPGVPHAIGDGVTLLEPQRIVKGKSGKTYRLWDWNRKYDSDGNIDQANGMPRPLHLKAGLKLIDPLNQVGTAFVESLRRRPRKFDTGKGTIFAFPENAFYSVLWLTARESGQWTVQSQDGFGIGIPLQGALRNLQRTIAKGQPFFIPAAMGELTFFAEAGMELALLYPSGTRVQVNQILIA